MFIKVIASILLLCTVAIGSIASPQRVSAKITNNYYVETTGHTFTDPFLTQWAQVDGDRSLGLPVSEVIEEDESRTQYFEYGALAAPNAANPRPADIEVVAAGREVLETRHDPTRLTNGRRVGGLKETAAFTQRAKPSNEKVLFDEETHHQVSGRILGFYKKNGGRDSFGGPLTDAYEVGGKRVQWFEQGRLEVVGDDEVVRGAAGLELAVARGVDIAKVKKGGLAAFDPDRFKPYFGDGTIPEAIGPFDPRRVRIPAINVDANLEVVDIVEGVMGTPQDVWAVGWYPVISEPGHFTNVVMAGHKDWHTVGPVVFWDLNLLVPGDKVYVVGDDGAGYTYVVTESFEVDANIPAGEVVSDTGTETLTLITCGGPFDGVHYLQRWIVRAERI